MPAAKVLISVRAFSVRPERERGWYPAKPATSRWEAVGRVRAACAL